MKNFNSLTEKEILALAISLEEEDERAYADFAEGLHQDHPAFLVVLVELSVISWIRHRYMDTPPLSAALQVGLGGILVFLSGILIGSS